MTLFNKAILNTEVQTFIKNYSDDISRLAFTGSPFKNITIQELIQQIEGRKKVEKKLPLWFITDNIYFPPKLNIEQTSSAVTANYKASLTKGASLADITGGFGVDSYYFSEKFKTVQHFEINKELSEIAKHNFGAFGKVNIQCFSMDGLQFALKNEFDVIYADPSRRHDTKGKVFFLHDCQPNIPARVNILLDHCNLLMLKTSPMLDISIGLNELKHVFEIHIVAIGNEVKELVWLIKKDHTGSPLIKTINFGKSSNETFNFSWNVEASAAYGLPLKFLFEPNSAISKSGAFDLISEEFNVKKLHKHTHLYTGDSLIDFPGRRFSIEQVVSYSKEEMRSAITFKKANVAIRNFPESVATLRKKWKIGDGGEIYLFFFTNFKGKKQMLVCSRV